MRLLVSIWIGNLKHRWQTVHKWFCRFFWLSWLERGTVSLGRGKYSVDIATRGTPKHIWWSHSSLDSVRVQCTNGSLTLFTDLDTQTDLEWIALCE